MWLSPFLAMYLIQSRERDAPVQNKALFAMVIEPKPGTYALVLFCETNTRIQIGRLGMMQLQRGYYVYVGSALAPGGLRARITHHQQLTIRPHWHIDYLQAQTRLHSVWLRYGGRRQEHEWARAMQKVGGAAIPLPRFGASDCSCPSHLYFLERCPAELPAIYGEKERIQQGWKDNNKVPSCRANNSSRG
jgi:Uri superfamily endonuclease